MTEVMHRINYVDSQQRLRSVTLLMVGSLCGLLGFLFAAFLGISTYKAEVDTNYLGQPYASGHNYFPQTVSEMVYDPTSACGKCFFAFCLIGAICILMSWYPWQLRNVYVGDDAKIGTCTWVNLRVYLPPVGMMLVACIPTTPAANATFRDRVTVLIHTAGAVMMIGGYAIFEVYTLFCASHTRVVIKKREWKIRLACVILSVIGIVGFQVCGLLATKSESWGWCCMDDWRSVFPADVDNMTAHDEYGKAAEDSLAIDLGHKAVFNTAYGRVLRIKQAEYWFEVFAGLFMIASHLTIWWYCPERSLDVSDALPDLWTEHPDHKGSWKSLYEDFDENIMPE